MTMKGWLYIFQSFTIKCNVVSYTGHPPFLVGKGLIHSMYSEILFEHILWKFDIFDNLDGNYTRMLRAILNKSWKQNPTKQ